MSQEFERHLAEALIGLDQGQAIDTVLGRYPEEADELAPLLETAVYARQVLDYFEPPSAVGLATGRRRMLEAAARKRATSARPWWQPALAAPGRWFRAPARGLAMAALLLALFLAVSGVTVVAAADSLPGDPLYGVKRLSERVRLSLTTDPAARAALQARFNRERQAEARAVAALRRRARLRFEGILERRMDGTWIVDGIELVVDPATVEGEPMLGSVVVVDVVSPGDGVLHVEHLTVHGGQPGPMEPARPGRSAPKRGPHTLTPSTQPPVTPSAEQRLPMATVTPTAHPMETHEPAMPMPTDDMGPRPPHPAAQPSPTHGPMGPITSTGLSAGMGQPTATGAPQETGPAPTQAPPTQTPAPAPTHHGPMMPQPTEMPHPGPPHPTQPPGGHHGGPGGHQGR